MVIRDAQRQTLQQSKHDDFVDRLMSHFRKVWPDKATALGPGYRDWIDSGVVAASRYELNTEQEAARFVNLWFVWGRAFETLPEHRAPLSSCTTENANPTSKSTSCPMKPKCASPLERRTDHGRRCL